MITYKRFRREYEKNCQQRIDHVDKVIKKYNLSFDNIFDFPKIRRKVDTYKFKRLITREESLNKLIKNIRAKLGLDRFNVYEE